MNDRVEEAPGYCRECAGTLEWRLPAGDDHRRRICAACGRIDYRQPKLGAGVVLVRDGCLLMTRRSIEPYRGLWCLPAGFVEENEGTATCAAREAREETGFEVAVDRVFNVYDYTDDPRGRGTLILYEARILGGEAVAGDDAAELSWMPIESIDETSVAFKQHRRAIRELRARRQGETTDATRT